MNVGRSYGNVVQLPDGSLVAVGGGAGQRGDGTDVNFTGGDERLKQVELLRPGVDTALDARPAAAQVARVSLDRAAAARRPGPVGGRRLLAPRHAGAPAGRDPMDVGEIYSPPYLFDGDQLAPRPLIEDAPVAVPYGAPFGIRVATLPARCSWRRARRLTART